MGLAARGEGGKRVELVEESLGRRLLKKLLNSPHLRDSTSVDFPDPEWPNSLSLILGWRFCVGRSCWMKSPLCVSWQKTRGPALSHGKVRLRAGCTREPQAPGPGSALRTRVRNTLLCCFHRNVFKLGKAQGIAVTILVCEVRDPSLALRSQPSLLSPLESQLISSRYSCHLLSPGNLCSLSLDLPVSMASGS